MDHGNNLLFECCSAVLKFSSVDATGVYENIMFSADEQAISDHIYANAMLMSFLDPQMSRCILWKEILSKVIGSSNLNDYRVVNRMITAIADARQAVIAEENDQFLFLQHNTPNTTVLAQIDTFLGVGAEIDNPILKIEKLSREVLRVIEFIEQKLIFLNDVVETYDLLRESVSNVESLSNRIIKGEITYDHALKYLTENEELTGKLMDYHNNFVTLEPLAQDMGMFFASVPGGFDNVNPTIGRMKTWAQDNNYLAYSRVRTPPREMGDIQAYRGLANRNTNMYTALFPYRGMNGRPEEPVVEPPNLRNESSNERDDWRSNVGSRQDSKDFTDRKINRFIRNLKDVSTRLTDEVIENKTEAVVESLREEVAELDR